MLEPLGRIVILSPHYDDAVYSCYSELGAVTAVINLFTDCPRGKERRAEDQAALPQLYAAERVWEAGLKEQSRPEPGAVAERVRAILLEHDLTGGCLMTPAGLGWHPHGDHRRTRLGICKARIPGWEVWLYADWPYWTDLWRGDLGCGRLQPWANRQFQEVLGGRPADRGKHLTPGETQDKMSMMLAYGGETMGRDTIQKAFRRETWRWEAFWRTSDIGQPMTQGTGA